MSDSARYDVTAAGEVLLRLSVPSGAKLETAPAFDVTAAGSEANVLAALSALDRRCRLATRLPANELGRLVRRQLGAAGIEIDRAGTSDAGRLGTFFVELAAPPAPTRIVYDRADSCMATLALDGIDTEELLQTRILHITGITAALSGTCRTAVTKLRAHAVERAVPVSFDINYRETLWNPEDAATALEPLIQGAEILFCSARDAQRVFGLEGGPSDVAAELAEMSRAQTVVVSSGASGASLFSAGTTIHVGAPEVQAIDRLGAGDGLAAGVLDGWLDGDLEQGLRRGVALAALALTHAGDFLATSRRELDELTSHVPPEEVVR